MKSKTSVFTVRLPVKLQEKLDHLAESMDRPRSWVVSQAMANYIQEHEAFIAAVKEGIDAAERGEFATDEEVDAIFKKYDC